MNPVIQAQLKAFSESNSGVKLSESEFFEVFSIYSVTNGLLTDNVDPFKAHLQGHEFGIDGVTILVQGELCTNSDETHEALSSGRNHAVEFCFFQSKTTEKADYGDMCRFFDGVFSFFDDSFLNPSAQLTDLLSAKAEVYRAALKHNPTLKLFYITTGKGLLSDQIQKLVDEKLTAYKGMNIFEGIEFKLIGARDLQTGYRSATNSNSERIEITKPITLPSHSSVQQAFLGYIAADQLVKLATVKHVGDSLPRINRAVFFDNVRDFDEKSEINQGILEELRSGDKNSFIFKNNGVTVVAKNLRRQGDSFELEDYQIVNGCQTSNILFRAGAHADGVHVPFRLIVSDDPDFVSTVIVGTNRQNEVKEDQFWALTPFMKDLEEFCREQPDDQKLFIERRENQYRAESVERTRICKPSELIKSVAAMFMFQPHRAARDYRGIRKQYSSVLFKENHSVRLYHAAAFANYKLDFAIRNRRVDQSQRIYKYYVLFMLGKENVDVPDLFSASRRQQERVAERIIEITTEEESLIHNFNSTTNILDSLVYQAKLDTREKVRDYIRSESVTEAFSKELNL